MRPRLLVVAHRRWLITLVIIALCCATASFTYYTEFSSVVASGQNAIDRIVVPLIFTILALSSPMLLIAILLGPSARTLACTKIHAAIFVSYFGIYILAFEPSYLSSKDYPGFGMHLSFFLVLGFEIAVMELVSTNLPDAGHNSLKAPLLFTSLTTAILVGWTVGILVWSERLPARVLMAAETAANGRPYCLDAAGQPVETRRDLTGASMQAPSDSGYFLAYHALLVVGDGAGMTYLNWSYRTGRFEPLGDGFRKRIWRLNERAHCKPTPGFVRGLT